MTDRTDRIASWGIILLVGLLDLSCIKGDFVAFKPVTPAVNPAPGSYGPTTPKPDIDQSGSWLSDIGIAAMNLLALWNLVDRRLHTAKSKGAAK